MTNWGKVTGARFAAFATLAAACITMSACEGRGYGAPADHPTAAPSEGSDALMGAPDGGPGATRSPEYVPPQGPPPSGEPSPPAYAQGYAPPPAAQTPVIGMDPIPNPPEPEHRVGHHRHRTPGYWGPVHTAPEHHSHHHRHHLLRAASMAPALAPVRHPHPTPLAARAPAAKAAQPAKPQFTAPKPAAAKPHKAQDAATTAAATGGPQPSNTTANTAGDPGASYDALQSALTDAFTRSARLVVPGQMTTGQPSDVTLTLPADFGDTVKTEASNNNLSSEAAAVNVSATLSGDGYTVTPTEPLSQPLTSGTPTVFRWKVTPQTEARAPLHADGRALLVASGRSLAIGTVKPGSGAIGRVVGVGLLALIALILLAWAAQRRRPKPTGAIRPAQQSNYKPPA